MRAEPVYSIILPTYNEKTNIALITWLIINSLKGKCQFELLVVDDNSPDGTADIFRSLMKAYPEEKLLLLERPGKLGLGTAYIDGMKKVTGDFIILMDADMSHHPKFILDFIKLQKEGDYDIVTGTRYDKGGSVYGWNMRRILTSKVANHIAQTLLNPKVTDLTGSFRLYKKEVLQSIIAKVQSRGYVFQMEVICRARHMNYTIAEYPITFVDRIFGASKLGANEVVSYLTGLVGLFWKGYD